MKKHHSHSSGGDEAVESTAAAWLAERDDGLTPEAEAEFARWRLADPRHESAVRALEATWAALQQLKSFRPEAQVHPDSNLLARPAPGRRLHFPALAATAALAASLALAATWWVLRPAGPARDTSDPVFTTAENGYTHATLSDGSVLELNAGSEARVHFTPEERRVRLVRGEGHFTVAKNKARPFWVEAGPVSVRAVGTEFDVSLRSGSVEVLVTEGRVQVARAEPQTSATTLALPESVAEIAASQRSVISLQNMAVRPVVEPVSAALIRTELAWKGLRLKFENTPLADVVAQFNRCNQVQLELGDPELGSKLVGGSFEAENVEAFVRLLGNGNGIAAERTDATHIVLRRNP